MPLLECEKESDSAQGFFPGESVLALALRSHRARDERAVRQLRECSLNYLRHFSHPANFGVGALEHRHLGTDRQMACGGLILRPLGHKGLEIPGIKYFVSMRLTGLFLSSIPSKREVAVIIWAGSKHLIHQRLVLLRLLKGSFAAVVLQSESGTVRALHDITSRRCWAQDFCFGYRCFHKECYPCPKLVAGAVTKAARVRRNAMWLRPVFSNPIFIQG